MRSLSIELRKAAGEDASDDEDADGDLDAGIGEEEKEEEDDGDQGVKRMPKSAPCLKI